MIPSAFEYVRVGSPVEAFVALEHPEARVIAGGHSLLPMMKLRLATPSRLVDIADLPWRDLGVDESGYRIGALTTYDELLRSARVTGCDALYECAARVGDLQVRNAGTVGGGLAHADPAADLAAGVLALEAHMLLESRDGARSVPAADFFLGPFCTAMRDDELLAAIVLPLPARFVRSAYVSVEDPASGYPIAGAAARVGLVDGRVMQCSVGLTGASTRPLRLDAVETLVVEHGVPPMPANLFEALGDISFSDEVGIGADYRRHLSAVVAHRAIVQAVHRASDEGRP